MIRRSGGAAELALAVAVALAAGGCAAGPPRPMGSLDRRLEQAGAAHDPFLAGRWLAAIGERGEREQVLLVDVERELPVPLPGLNRPDAQPLSVAVDAAGERLAVVRQIAGRTELVLHRRPLASTETIPLRPPGVPRRVALRADGRELAVEVSRDGRWTVDLIRLP
ncbi:MAG: hypothetical protein VKI81_01145 [Synechococcaceae cyanobacterium]|nr:hypothetical protein [Synechococcaceae cyanobacterium]